MEIPDSDEEEQSLPDVSQHDHDQQQQQQQQDLPLSSAQFIDRVLTQLNNITTTQQQQTPNNQNPFSSLPASELSAVKPLVLTLHCLFPNELLVALDILDRGLVRRLVSEEDQENHHDEKENENISHPSLSPVERSDNNKEEEEAIFLVISASTSASKNGTTRDEDKGYEVRLKTWNCTCHSFTLSVFRDLDSGLDLENHRHDHVEPISNGDSTTSTPPKREYRFGGSLTRGSTGSSPPVCKHLLACVLVVRCPKLFGTGPGGRMVVSAKELAGWCAGWGG